MIKGQMRIERHMYYDVVTLTYESEYGQVVDYYVNPRRDEGEKELTYVYSVYEKRSGFFRGDQKLTSEEQSQWSELLYNECKAPYCDEECETCKLDVCPFEDENED